jgi:2-dehydropantoate 2-reductase
MNKVVVIGGGAMGAIFAVGLAQVGRDVTVLDTATELVERINAEGIAISSGGELVVTKVPATTDPSCLSTTDLAIVFVKAHHTPSVAQALGGHLSSDAIVLSLQNGWGNSDLLAEGVVPARLVMGVTYHSGTVVSPGQVAHTGRGPTFVGPYEATGGMDHARLVAEALTEAQFETSATADVRTEIWNKLILNAATLPVAASTGLRAAEMLEVTDVAVLVESLANEAVAVAAKLGLRVDGDERIARIRTVLANAGQGKPSMLQDVEAHRKTEIEVVNGAVARAAAECGIDVPLNVAMCAVVHGIERSWSR